MGLLIAGIVMLLLFLALSGGYKGHVGPRGPGRGPNETPPP